MIRTWLQSLRDTDALVPFDQKLAGFQSVQPNEYDALARDIETAELFDRPR